MEIEDIRVGMRVKVDGYGGYTRDTQGLNSDMKKRLGTHQTVSEICLNSAIILKGESFWWDVRDLTLIIASVDGNKIVLKGDKQLFNEEELI